MTLVGVMGLAIAAANLKSLRHVFSGLCFLCLLVQFGLVRPACLPAARHFLPSQTRPGLSSCVLAQALVAAGLADLLC